MIYNLPDLWYDTEVNKIYHCSGFGQLQPNLSKWHIKKYGGTSI